MAHVQVVKTLPGTPESVFALCSDLERAADKIEGIVRIELLTEGPVGLGTRWRETRSFLGKQATEELEITGFEPPHSYEVSCESHGARFKTVFTLEAQGAETRVTIDFEATPQTFGAKLMVPMMMGTVRKCIDADFDQLAAWAATHAANG